MHEDISKNEKALAQEFVTLLSQLPASGHGLIFALIGFIGFVIKQGHFDQARKEIEALRSKLENGDEPTNGTKKPADGPMTAREQFATQMAEVKAEAKAREPGMEAPPPPARPLGAGKSELPASEPEKPAAAPMTARERHAARIAEARAEVKASEAEERFEARLAKVDAAIKARETSESASPTRPAGRVRASGLEM